MVDMSQKIKIIYEDNHLLVVEKPINVPVQEDQSKDADLLNQLKDYLKRKYHKPGNVYLGLVHRLDRPVGGIMVFAKTSKAASRLSEQVRTHQFQKEYVAVVMGKIEASGHLEDHLIKDKKKNIVRVDPSGKQAVLDFRRLSYNDQMSLVLIHLKTGRSHQIRVQFSYHGYPLYGDQKYGRDSKVGEQIALFAKSITFIHPTTKEKLTFSLPIPKTKPWNLFSDIDCDIM